MKQPPRKPNHDPFVVCAALRFGDVIVCGPRHFDHVMQPLLENVRATTGVFKPEQGFVDQYGKFMTREEALLVAEAEGQINERRPKTSPATSLFSEDLY